MASLKLSEDIATRQDLQTVTLEVKNYAAWAEHAAVKKQVTKAAKSDPPAISAAAAGMINQWQAGKDTAGQSLDGLIKSLEDFAAAAPHATITLAAPAPAKLKHDIVGWFRTAVRPDMLVDFKFDSTMLGGMMVACGSRVFDWSFKRQILAGRDKFPEVLKNV